MIEIEPIIDKFSHYQFRDEHGHPLTNCVDFLELAFLAAAQIQNCWTEITNEPTTWPPINQLVWGLGADDSQNTFKRTGNAIGWNRDYADFGPKFAERVTHWRPLPLSPGVEAEVTINLHGALRESEQFVDAQHQTEEDRGLPGLESELENLQFCFSPNQDVMRRTRQVEALITNHTSKTIGVSPEN